MNWNEFVLIFNLGIFNLKKLFYPVTINITTSWFIGNLQKGILFFVTLEVACLVYIVKSCS